MRNPYTGISFSHPHATGRARKDFAFLVIMALGVVYLFAYMWPWWPWTARLNNSAEAVGFLYFFLGGYAFVRSSGRRLEGDGASNRWIAYVLAPVAAWDVVSPIFLLDLHPLSLGAHVVGGLVAFVCVVVAIRGYRREAVLKGETTVRGA